MDGAILEMLTGLLGSGGQTRVLAELAQTEKTEKEISQFDT